MDGFVRWVKRGSKSRIQKTEVRIQDTKGRIQKVLE
jgi:hypothetical protein